MKSTRIIVTIPIDILADITKLAGMERTSVSEQIRQAIIERVGRGSAKPVAVITGMREPKDSPARIETRGEVLTDFDFGA